MDIVLLGLVPILIIFGLRFLTSGKYRSVSASEAKQLISEGYSIIDVRERDECSTGIVPTAQNVPLSQLSKQLDSLPAGKILVYCASGMRSRIAASRLCRSGDREVANLSGGIAAWRQCGYPLARP
jgi:rhodanese-related sulfurtransferase